MKPAAVSTNIKLGTFVHGHSRPSLASILILQPNFYVDCSMLPNRLGLCGFTASLGSSDLC